jgi:hypothetical protein
MVFKGVSVHRIWIILVVIAAVFAAYWFFDRVCHLGVNNVFSREHVFRDDRELTDEVAIEITRWSLEASGYNMSLVAPYSGFSRNSLNPKEGYVLWGWKSHIDQWHFSVRIEKENGIVRSRVFRRK